MSKRERPEQGAHARISNLVLIALALGVILVLDRYVVGGSLFVAHAAADSIAHALTAAIWASTLRVMGVRIQLIPALIGGVVIDLDHAVDIFGFAEPPDGTSRQVTHSLMTVAVLLIIGLARRRSRGVWFSAAVGTTSHLLRDLCRGSVLIWWPLSLHPMELPYWVINVVTGLLVLGASLTHITRRSQISQETTGRVENAAGSWLEDRHSTSLAQHNRR